MDEITAADLQGPIKPRVAPSLSDPNAISAADLGPDENAISASDLEDGGSFLGGAGKRLVDVAKGAGHQMWGLAKGTVKSVLEPSPEQSLLPMPLRMVSSPEAIETLKGAVTGPIEAVRNVPKLFHGGAKAGEETVDLALQVGLPLLGLRESFKGKPNPNAITDAAAKLSPEELARQPMGSTPPLEESGAAPGVVEGHAGRLAKSMLETERRKENLPVAAERRSLDQSPPQEAPPASDAELAAEVMKIANKPRPVDPEQAWAAREMGSSIQDDSTVPPEWLGQGKESITPEDLAKETVLGKGPVREVVEQAPAPEAQGKLDTVAKSGLLGEHVQLFSEAAARSMEPGPAGNLPRNLPNPASADVPKNVDVPGALTKGTITGMAEPSGSAVLAQAAARHGPKETVPWADMDEQVKAKQVMVGSIMAKRVSNWDATDLGAVYSVAKQEQVNLKALYDQLDNADNAGGIKALHEQISAAEARISAMVSKISEARSVAGREFNYLKQVAQDLGPVSFLNKAREVKLGEPLSQVEEATIRGLVARGATDEAISYIRSMQKYTKMEQFIRGWKDFLISGMGTAAKIGLNTPLYGIFQLIQKPARVLLSKSLKPFTGVDSDIFLGNLRGEVWSNALKEGVANIKDISKGKTPNYLSGNEGPFGIINLEARPFKDVPLLGKPLTLIDNTVSRTHLALHQTTFQPVFQSATAELALGITKLEHPELSGTAFYEAASQLYKNPTAEMTVHAMDRAWQATFLNPNIVSKMMGRVHQFLRSQGRSGALLELGTQYLVPFARISSNLIGRAMEMTPVGFIWSLSDLYKLFEAVKSNAPKMDIIVAQQAFVRRLVNAGAGTTALFMTGYFMAKNGHMMGAEPSNAMEKRLWDIQGRSPFSITLDNSKTWHNLRMLGPLGMSMMMGAAVYYETSNPMEEGIGKVGGAVVGAAAPIMHESFLQNAGDLIDGLAGKPGSGGRMMDDLIGGMVPNVVAEMAKATDPYTRKPGTMLEHLEARIPGLSSNVPPKIGAGGTPLQHETGFSAFLGGNYPKEPDLNFPATAKFEQLNVLKSQYTARTNALMKQMQAVARAGGAMTSQQRMATIQQLRQQMAEAGRSYSEATRSLMRRQ